MHKKLIYGIALNDAGYSVQPVINGKRSTCPFYRVWFNMLTRCYNKSLHLKHKSYSECRVCEDWLIFSNFKIWMQSQEWRHKHLDKDILINGNKIYSPESCAFVGQEVNKFLTDRVNDRGDFLIGASWKSENGAFQSQCSNPITKKYEHLGYFDSDLKAHQAWKKRKHELACQLAEIQTDERVANALRTRYLQEGI